MFPEGSAFFLTRLVCRFRNDSVGAWCSGGHGMPVQGGSRGMELHCRLFAYTPPPEGTRFRGSSLEGAVGGLPSGVVVEVPEVVLCGFTSSVAPLASIYGNDVEGAYAFAQAMRYS